MRRLLLAALALAGPAGAVPTQISVVIGVPNQVAAIVDGDTLDIVRRGGGNVRVERLRVEGIDTPEKNSACAEEKRHAYLAAARLQALTRDGVVAVSHYEDDKYGRALAFLFLAKPIPPYPAGKSVGDILVEERFARPYTGETRRPWCDGVGNLTP